MEMVYLNEKRNFACPFFQGNKSFPNNMQAMGVNVKVGRRERFKSCGETCEWYIFSF